MLARRSPLGSAASDGVAAVSRRVNLMESRVIPVILRRGSHIVHELMLAELAAMIPGFMWWPPSVEVGISWRNLSLIPFASECVCTSISMQLVQARSLYPRI